MKKGLIVFALVLLLTVGAVAGYEIYMNTREYTIDDLNGIWTCELDSGQHYVLYIHDGRMDLMRYERKDESDARGMDRYRAMVMDTVPEGTFNKFSWREILILNGPDPSTRYAGFMTVTDTSLNSREAGFIKGDSSAGR